MEYKTKKSVVLFTQTQYQDIVHLCHAKGVSQGCLIRSLVSYFFVMSEDGKDALIAEYRDERDFYYKNPQFGRPKNC